MDKILKFSYEAHKKGLKTDGANDWINNSNLINFNSDFSLCFVISFQSYFSPSGIEPSIMDTSSFSLDLYPPAYGAILILKSGFTWYAYPSYYMNLNVIYNVVITKSGSTIEFYINNVLQTTTYGGTPSITNTSQFILGAYQGYTKFGAFTYYDFKIFNKALNQTEVTTLYNSFNRIIPQTALSYLQVDHRFDENKGYFLTDYSGNNRNATLINYSSGTTDLGSSNRWVDIYGNSIMTSFKNKLIIANNKIQKSVTYHKYGLKTDGVNDYLDFGNPSLFDFTTTDFSICLRCKWNTFPSGYGAVGFLEKGIYNQNGYYFLYQNTTTSLSFFVNQSGAYQGIIPRFTMSLNTIYSIILTRNGSIGSMYINGIEPIYALRDSLISPASNNSTLVLSNRYSQNVGMTFYDFKMFNKALTSTEVTSLYSTDHKITPSTALSYLICDYDFSNGSGYKISDKTTNGNNGTLINYAAGTTDLGINNMWKDIYDNPILT